MDLEDLLYQLVTCFNDHEGEVKHLSNDGEYVTVSEDLAYVLSEIKEILGAE